MPISKSKRKSTNKSRRNRKSRATKLQDTASSRSVYIGVGISFIVIGFLLMIFGDGGNSEFGFSMFSIIIGVMATLFGKLASAKQISKSNKGFSNSDTDIDLF